MRNIYMYITYFYTYRGQGNGIGENGEFSLTF